MAVPIFLHSMWRTGSSYLLSRFAQSERYLPFYEPFNGEIGSRRLRERAARQHDARREALRHPAFEGGYFGIYDEPDPASGRPLWRYGHPRLTLHDVYNGLSPQGLALLQACQRLADQRGRQAVYGFCHSGAQVGDMRQAMGGVHIHLWRDARDQFASSDPQANDFFIAATALQVVASARLRAAAAKMMPWIRRLGLLPAQALIRSAPHRASMRLGRALWRRLDLAEAYQLFYLTWRAADEEGARHCELRLSMRELQEDAALRRLVEQRFDIRFEGLRYRANAVDKLGLDFTALEAKVCQALAATSATPGAQ